MKVPRLSETEILIASAISGKELYGLQIVDEVLALTRGKRRISLGGLYTTLHRMESKKLVTSRWGETVVDRQGARRRYYKIAGLGARALSETERVLAGRSPRGPKADGGGRLQPPHDPVGDADADRLARAPRGPPHAAAHHLRGDTPRGLTVREADATRC